MFVCLFDSFDIDLVTGVWYHPDAFPIFVRRGARDFLVKMAAAGWELVLWSRRSFYKTNTGLHLIDPGFKLFPLSHRFYADGTNHHPSHLWPVKSLNRDLANVVFLDKYFDWEPSVASNQVSISEMKLPTKITKETTADNELEQLWLDIFQPLTQTPGDIKIILNQLKLKILKK